MKIKLKENKTEEVGVLIFSMLDILGKVGIPLNGTARRLERMAMACLAVGDIRTNFQEAKSADDDFFLTSREIIAYENENYGEHISSGSYDDIRRKDLELPVQAEVVVKSSSFDTQATNNPKRAYALHPLFADLVKHYNMPQWEEKLESYLNKIQLFKEELERKRELEKIPVRLPSGIDLQLSVGEHNVLQNQLWKIFCQDSEWELKCCI